MIANGEVSDDFYVSTRPSSPPTQLLCMATSANTMRFEWQNPLFMPDLESISFLYNLTPENTSELHSCKFDTNILKTKCKDTVSTGGLLLLGSQLP